MTKHYLHGTISDDHSLHPKPYLYLSKYCLKKCANRIINTIKVYCVLYFIRYTFYNIWDAVCFIKNDYSDPYLNY